LTDFCKTPGSDTVSRKQDVRKTKIKLSSSFILPRILKQLRGFLGITGLCRLWIPGYGEIAGPLYQLVKETQTAATHLLKMGAQGQTGI
jgi:hypothetical protein